VGVGSDRFIKNHAHETLDVRKDMTIGGRPKEEGGHRRLQISLDEETYKALEKIRERNQNRSKFIENALRPNILQLDPGESCETLHEIDQLLWTETFSAILKKDFDKVATLATVGSVLAPYRDLCRESDSGDAMEKRECAFEPEKPYDDTVCGMIERLLESRKKASSVCNC